MIEVGNKQGNRGYLQTGVVRILQHCMKNISQKHCNYRHRLLHDNNMKPLAMM